MLKAGLMCGEALSEQGMWGDTDIADKGKRKNENRPRAIFTSSIFRGIIWLVFICMVYVYGSGGGQGFTYTV